MAWIKHFSKVNLQNTSSLDGYASACTSGSFTSYLPEVYAGHPHRIQRYYQYDDMDRDSDVHSALDTIADFCTQSEEQSDNPFDPLFHGDDASETEVTLINESLIRWVKLNNFRSRLWDIFRKTIKNGDSFFLRDPENGEWLWIDHFSVEMVKVDEEHGKDPDEYIIRGMDLNKQAKFATRAADPLQYRTPLGNANSGGSRPIGTGNSSVFSSAGTHADNKRMEIQNQLCVVDAQHVVHLSLSTGMDVNWPFGESVLEPIFKVYKQKELLEDAIIIYRVQRAPERRIFYIDTGSMPVHKAKAYIEQFKNEVHSRRIPGRSATGSSVMDGAYNPLSSLDDYYFAQSCIRLNEKISLLDGRELALRDIIEEYKAGKVNYTYSLNLETHEFEPGKIVWADVTRKNAALVRITLDSGEHVDTTPDHRFIMRDGTEILAGDLKPEDSLIPLIPEITICVVSVEFLTETDDTGDITVESASNSHVFALSCGVYVHNSEGRGSKVETLPGGECFDLSTRIPLLDGRTLMLSEIIKEFEDGKLNWAYSINPKTGECVPGMIDWAGVTRKDAKVMKITLDNGKSVICTPDHRWPVQGGTEKQARELTVDDSLFPFELRKEKINNKKNAASYTQVFDTSKKKWVFVHRLVAEHLRGSEVCKEMIFEIDEIKKNVVHHKDFNRYNNDPSNLTWMSWKDHSLYHQKFLSDYSHLAVEGIKRFWKEMSPEERSERAEKSRRRSLEALAKKTPEELNEFIRKSITNLEKGEATKKSVMKLKTDLEFRERVLKTRAEGISKAYTDERKEQISARNCQKWENGDYDFLIEEQTLVFDDEMLSLFEQNVSQKTSKLKKFVEKINDSDVIKIFKDKNANTKARNCDIKNFVFESRHVTNFLNRYNFTWNAFRDKSLGNKKLNQSANFNTDFSLMQTIAKIVASNKRINVKSLAEQLNSNEDFIKRVKDLNPKQHHLSSGKINRRKIMTILNDHGYNGWDEFLEKVENFNHKIVSIEYLEETMDVGTITIDGLEVYHNHHTFALDVGIYTSNCVGEIGDLLHFRNQMFEGLRIPPAYSFRNVENGGMSYNDGKMGSALVQEFLFNKYCIRLQGLLAKTFDFEFKHYLRKTGIEIDENIFELKFCTPQNFSKYRDIEVDSQRVNLFSQVSENKLIANRMKLTKYLGWTEDEVLMNEKLWKEENPEKIKKKTGNDPVPEDPSGLSAVGVSSGGMFPDTSGTDSGMDDFAPEEGGGGEAAPSPDSGGGPPAGGGEPPSPAPSGPPA